MFHQVLANLPKLYNGKISKSRKVETFRAKNLAAVSGEDVIVEVDGEQPGRLPLNARIAPGALNLITA
jgi:diacylglycerol kinase family enzyme